MRQKLTLHYNILRILDLLGLVAQLLAIVMIRLLLLGHAMGTDTEVNTCQGDRYVTDYVEYNITANKVEALG